MFAIKTIDWGTLTDLVIWLQLNGGMVSYYCSSVYLKFIILIFPMAKSHSTSHRNVVKFAGPLVCYWISKDNNKKNRPLFPGVTITIVILLVICASQKYCKEILNLFRIFRIAAWGQQSVFTFHRFSFDPNRIFLDFLNGNRVWFTISCLNRR